ncbi:MAG: hypothetical protein DI537_10485 [Stutzerimonas stutzeri]|nr:MAG: hypothetical protein DI537_10485 [Stutzerimonas stutzeri]
MDMLTIYADGACSGNPGPAGSAILLLKPTGGKLVPVGSMEQSIGHATNQIAELVAAKMAIDAAAERDETEILVRCDSEYVVKGINEWMAGWIKNGWRNAAKKPVSNKEHWLAILAGLEGVRGAGKTIRFEWVRGHDSDHFNNQVDALAVAASKMPAGRSTAAPAVALPLEPTTGRPDLSSDAHQVTNASQQNEEAIRDLKGKLSIAVSWIEGLQNTPHQMPAEVLATLKAALGR